MDNEKEASVNSTTNTSIVNTEITLEALELAVQSLREQEPVPPLGRWLDTGLLKCTKGKPIEFEFQMSQQERDHLMHIFAGNYAITQRMVYLESYIAEHVTREYALYAENIVDALHLLKHIVQHWKREDIQAVFACMNELTPVAICTAVMNVDIKRKEDWKEQEERDRELRKAMGFTEVDYPMHKQLQDALRKQREEEETNDGH